ncbi:MAG: 1-deoxy-D-xylulose-5-phosphate synthase [Eubacterium sp.]|nr:1-deoxy-D-xylulose-5-phosphate synthase [Candidatus Colimonas fimequi]
MNKFLREHNFPEDLKNMTYEDLELLTFEIRDFLVDSVSKTGGHLASNLGAVELTIALLKTFDAPKDKILWDVGHQTYVYKMLTGRMDGFKTLRQLDGMSGFPKVKESDYDVFDTGHSSTSISLGMGIAAARDLQGEDYNVVSVIGDGSMTGGIAFEALNNINNLESKMIIILNDNGMSISPNTGGLSSYLTKMRGTRKYINMKANIKKRMGRVPVIGDGMISGVHNAKESIKSAVIVEEGLFFEELGIKYFGPIDGHNIEELCETLEVAKSFDKPVIIHAMTEKGKGYSKAEANPSVFHGIGPFDPDTGKAIKKSSAPSYSKVFGDKLTAMADNNDKIVAISAAMIDGTGLEGFAKAHPDRMYDVGIAEGHAVAFASGMAKAGIKPYVAVYSTFLQRAYDQLVEDICLQNLPAVFCLDRAGIVGADGETHHGILDLSYLSSMPNMTIMAPKDGPELENMMNISEAMDGPCAIRYPRGSTPVINEEPVVYGKAEYLREGDEVVIWAIGSMVSHALEAADLLQAEGINAAVYNARFLKPIDDEAIRQSAKNAKLIMTIEDNVLSGGLGEAIDSIIINEGVKIVNLSWPDQFIEHGTQAQLYERYGLDSRSIAERIKKELER